MKPLSPRTIELLQALERAEPGFRARLFHSEDPRLALLEQLSESPEPGVLPRLLPLVADGSRAVAAAAASLIARIVSQTTAVDLMQLDGTCRTARSYYSPRSTGWSGLAPVAVSGFERFGDAAVAITGIASFHPNGYVREAAVARLDASTDARELPFLLIRLNDWVPVIADRAREAVVRRIRPGYGAAFMASLPILDSFHLPRRRDHRDLNDHIMALLRSPEERSTLTNALGSSDRRIRRLAFVMARALDGADHAGLLERALGDPDTTIRLYAVAISRRGIDPTVITALLGKAVADPYPPVRREALAVAAYQLTDQADVWLMAALLDRNVVVREVARSLLLRRGRMTEFAAFYRDRIRPDAPQRELGAAIAGLGETGVAGDVELIAPWLTHERAGVRRAAVRAIGALDLPGQVERIAQMLRDGAPSVSHVARDLVRRRAHDVGSSTLLRILREAPHLHSRVDALKVAASLGKWERLPLLIEGVTAGDERIRELARSLLASWIATQNRDFAAPTPAQVDAINAAVDAHHLALDRPIAAEIRASMRVWSR